MELQDVLIQTSGALFFCAVADDDGDSYMLPTDKTALILQAQQPNGQIAMSFVKSSNMLGKPTTIWVSKYGACVQDVTDTEFLSKVYATLTGVIRATTGQARRVIEAVGGSHGGYIQR